MKYLKHMVALLALGILMMPAFSMPENGNQMNNIPQQMAPQGQMPPQGQMAPQGNMCPQGQMAPQGNANPQMDTQGHKSMMGGQIGIDDKNPQGCQCPCMNPPMGPLGQNQMSGQPGNIPPMGPQGQNQMNGQPGNIPSMDPQGHNSMMGGRR